MKIAIDIREAGKEKTGKGWYTFNLVNQLLKLDKKNTYILYTNTSKNPYPEAKNIEIKHIESKPRKWHFAVLKDLRKNPVDLFFAPTSYIIPAFAPKKMKVIMTVHDLVAFLFPSTHNTKATIIERLTLRKALKKTDAIFTVSENTKKDLLKRFDYPEENIFLTSCAPSDIYSKKISDEDLQKYSKKKKLPDKFILAVGTLEPRKNFTMLIKSFVMLKKWHPDYKLIIVGKKGWKFEEIQKTVKQYKLEEDIIFPGYVKDEELHMLYRLAAVFVFPSLYEGFGIPPLEAMASGCPVVSSNVASLPEVIGEAGLLIDPSSAYKLADTVSSLLKNESVRSLIIQRGLQQAKKFSWKQSAQTALETFTELAK